MKKLLHNITGWLVKKTNYTPAFPLPIQPIIITPEDFKKFHAQRIVDWLEWNHSRFTKDDFVRGFKYQIVNDLLEYIEVKLEQKPEGMAMSCDLLMKSI